jgi:hypothetical protein
MDGKPRGRLSGGERVKAARVARHQEAIWSPLADRWAVWNNDNVPPVLLAESKTWTRAGLEAILEAR